MRIGLRETLEINREDNRIYRRRCWILVGLLIAFFLLFINEMQDGATRYYVPWVTWRHLFYYMQAGLHRVFHVLPAPAALAGSDEFYYSFTLTQLKRLLASMACGALLALSGNIFQNVFRNPMAAPTMLGVNTGVNAAMLYLAVVYGSTITALPGIKYKYCYIGAAVMLAAVMLLGKYASGRHRFDVDNLLLIGVSLSGVVGAVITGYAQAMDTDLLAVYQSLTGGGAMDLSRLSLIVLAIAFAVSVIPMYLLRFSFNVVTNTPDEARGLGIDSNIFRFVTLVLGTFMMVAATIECGSISMISLAVPFIGRGIFGADFRKQFWGNMLLGALMMLICRGISNMMPWIGYRPFPISVIINVIVPPIFAIAVAKSKRIWD